MIGFIQGGCTLLGILRAHVAFYGIDGRRLLLEFTLSVPLVCNLSVLICMNDGEDGNFRFYSPKGDKTYV
jgi:hypothetical protein